MQVQILNKLSGEWRSGPDIPEKMAGHCALRIWDVIYVIGSVGGDVLSVFQFNITTYKWGVVANLGATENAETADPDSGNPSARQDFACSFSDCKTVIYVTGGLRGEEALTDFFRFNLTR